MDLFCYKCNYQPSTGAYSLFKCCNEAFVPQTCLMKPEPWEWVLWPGMRKKAIRCKFKESFIDRVLKLGLDKHSQVRKFAEERMRKPWGYAFKGRWEWLWIIIIFDVNIYSYAREIHIRAWKNSSKKQEPRKNCSFIN